MSLGILFQFLCTQNVSDINNNINNNNQEFATMLLNYHIGRIVLGSLCVGDMVRLGLSSVQVLQAEARFSLQHGYHSKPTAPYLQDTTNQEQ